MIDDGVFAVGIFTLIILALGVLLNVYFRKYKASESERKRLHGILSDKIALKNEVNKKPLTEYICPVCGINKITKNRYDNFIPCNDCLN